MVSAPPFEPFPEQAMKEFDGLAKESDVIIVAPVFFGKGNLAPLRTALRLVRTGKPVVVIGQPPIDERDLSDGQAASLVKELYAAGAVEVKSAAQAVERI